MRTMNFKSVASISSVIALTALVSGAASAQTITYDNSTNTAMGTLAFTAVDASMYNLTDFSTSILIPLFDPTGHGTLQTVTLQIDTAFYGSITFTNTSTSSASNVTAPTLEVDLNLSGGPNGTFDNGTNPNNPFSTATVAPNSADFTLDINNMAGTNPGSTKTVAYGSSSSPITGTSPDSYFLSSTGTNAQPTDVAAFSQTGGGTTSAAGSTTTFTSYGVSGGNLVVTQNTQAKLTGIVTYTYQPTPASPGDLSLISGLFVAGGMAWRGRRRKAVSTPA
jgi:hypothetical protein